MTSGQLGSKWLSVLFYIFIGGRVGGVVLCSLFRTLGKPGGNWLLFGSFLCSVGLAIHNCFITLGKLCVGNKLLFNKRTEVGIPPCKPPYIRDTIGLLPLPTA